MAKSQTAALVRPTQRGNRAEIRGSVDLNALLFRLLDEMARAGFTDKEQFGVRLALEEAIVNGIKHGNRDDPNKFVEVVYRVTSSEIIAEIEDQGPGFNPQALPNPLSPENIERPGGRGVFLMRHYMSTVEYNERGNRVTLSKVKG
ncbi:MAG: ATP-binding protein [Gemmataceae bacterium]|nr:ATP-binding protein [Gemmataceae bacterium]MCI0741330.1 ATP-binding protein [Gemmataceae bacterium]